MREILFRGKRIDNGEWVYGYYVKHNEQAFIFPIFEEPYQYDQNSYEVIPKTVGQFTGLYDKHNKPIYEGDIVKAVFMGGYSDGYSRDWHVETVRYLTHRSAFYPMSDCEINRNEKGNLESVIVIGNIYENSELLAGE